MGIETTDLKRYRTINTSPGMSAAQSDLTDSIGGYASSTVVNSSSPMNNLASNVSGDEAAAGITLYRCEALLNDHASLPLEGAKWWIVSQIALGATVSIGLDPTAASPKDQSGTPQFVRATNQTTAPAGVSFSAPTSKATGIAIGDLPAGYVKGLWFRYVVSAETAGLNPDEVQNRIEGDSDP